VAYRLTYRASELLEFASEKDVVKFRQHIEAAIERVRSRAVAEDAARTILDIRVRQNPRRGGTSQDLVKGLTLSVIPTWTTHEGTFEFALRLCEKDRMSAQAQYRIDTREFNWILVLPVSWINLFRWDEVYEFLGEAVAALLVDGTINATKEDALCSDKSPAVWPW
jgi:hypothetical protein